jgi:hypothetical protein
MLKREDIKNGTLVLYKTLTEMFYGLLTDVGDAREKGDRGCSTTPEDELSYSVVDIITNEIEGGICEYSGYNENLSVATIRDVEVYLTIKEGESIKRLGEAKLYNATIQDAMNKIDNIKCFR